MAESGYFFNMNAKNLRKMTRLLIVFLGSWFHHHRYEWRDAA